MSSQRKFYRSVVQVEVLSEDPWSEESLVDLGELAYAITDGDCSGKATVSVHNEEKNGKEMAELLSAQASDPGFFMLTDDGEDSE